MQQVLDTLTRLLAPILAFTADEAWEHSRGGSASVHLEPFPRVESAWQNPEVETEVARWLELRGLIAQQIEDARKEKQIGNALESSIVLEIADPALAHSLEARLPELEEFFILSELTVVAGSETRAGLTRVAHAKCSRCWRHRPSVGADSLHAELCDRCATVVAASGSES